MLRDKQVALFGGQTECPYWGTNRMPLLGDKQDALIRGQTACPYIWDKHIVLTEGQTGCPNRLPLLADKQVAQAALIEGQTGCFYWRNMKISLYFVMEKQVVPIENKVGCSY